MKQLIFLTILAFTSVFWLKAEENHEVIWETEQIGRINGLAISPLGELFYNTKDSIVQVRSVVSGELVEEILFPNTARLDAISISANGRYLAVSGQPKYIFIYDLVEKREKKRITTVVWEEEEFGEIVKYEAEKWACSSISPDGSKVTGVAISDAGVKKSNLVVIDIDSEEIIYESRRILYDINIQEPDNFEWISSEFSPDGNFIVSQLEYDFYHGEESDSVYIHDASTFEIYDVVLNDYNTTTSEIVFSKFEPIFCVPNNKSIILYDLLQKKTNTILFQESPRNIVFSALDKNLLIRLGINLPKVFNYESKQLKQQIDYVGLPQKTTKNNKVIYKPGHYFGLSKIDFNWNIITSIEHEEEVISQLSPNPTTGSIEIILKNKQTSEFHFELIDVSGQIIKASSLGILNSNSHINMDISGVPNGRYTLRVYSNLEEFIFNIIKEG